jgi:hypothetical protein
MKHRQTETARAAVKEKGGQRRRKKNALFSGPRPGFGAPTPLLLALIFVFFLWRRSVGGGNATEADQGEKGAGPDPVPTGWVIG